MFFSFTDLYFPLPFRMEIKLSQQKFNNFHNSTISTAGNSIEWNRVCIIISFTGTLFVKKHSLVFLIAPGKSHFTWQIYFILYPITNIFFYNKINFRLISQEKKKKYLILLKAFLKYFTCRLYNKINNINF